MEYPFLPYSGGKYKLAPYEEIDHRTYERLIKGLPLINYALLSKYEHQDNTQGKLSMLVLVTSVKFKE